VDWATFWAIFSQKHLVTLARAASTAALVHSNLRLGTVFHRQCYLDPFLPNTIFQMFHIYVRFSNKSRSVAALLLFINFKNRIAVKCI
jgi:hypothetical protein